jgi:hypothetical protein
MSGHRGDGRFGWPGGGAGMATGAGHARSNKAAPTKDISGLAARDGASRGPSLTSEQIWRKVAGASFAVLAYVTPRGEPRSSGVVYKVVGRRLYIAVAPDSLKVRHIAPSRKVRSRFRYAGAGCCRSLRQSRRRRLASTPRRSCIPPVRRRPAQHSRNLGAWNRPRGGHPPASSKSFPRARF